MEIKKKINPKKLRRDYLDSVEDNLAKEGLVVFDIQSNLHISKDFLSLPSHITEIPSRELGEHLNAFTQQKMYLRTLLGRIEISLEQAKQKYFKISNSSYVEYTKTRMSETSKERILVTELCDTEEYAEYIKAVERKRLVELNINNIEDAIFLLSREVSRRTGDFNDETRLHNI